MAKNMVKVAKQMHATKIVKKLGYAEGAVGHKEKVKDILKLSYTTLFELSNLISRKGGK